MSEQDGRATHRCDNPRCDEILESHSEDVDYNWCSVECFADANGLGVGSDSTLAHGGRSW